MLRTTMFAVTNWLRPERGTWQAAIAIVLATSSMALGCAAAPAQPVAKEVVIWKNLGEWSGRGDTQTESFVGLTGALRMHWQTKNESTAGAGRFRMILHSAISGRDLQVTVDETGPGEGTEYTAEDPRVFYITIESANLDWSFTVEEAMFGSQAPATTTSP